MSHSRTTTAELLLIQQAITSVTQAVTPSTDLSLQNLQKQPAQTNHQNQQDYKKLFRQQPKNQQHSHPASHQPIHQPMNRGSRKG